MEEVWAETYQRLTTSTVYRYSFLGGTVPLNVCLFDISFFHSNKQVSFTCRGYYKCSSVRGCPARKQVERSRDDPTMIIITYTSEHNHPWPLASSSRNGSKPKPEPKPEPEVLPEVEQEEEEEDNNNKFMVLGREVQTVPSCVVDEFAWFSEMETTSSTILESPIFSSEKKTAASAAADDVGVFFPMGEEDESLFADLGELPECSVVFRHRSSVVGSQVEIF